MAGVLTKVSRCAVGVLGQQAKFAAPVSVASRRNYASKKRIDVVNPVVELDGDEMTRIIWEKIKETLIFPYLNVSGMVSPTSLRVAC
ncbi:isocitrate dehydrogenase [NADP], mitochondrial-like, partial [Amphibalanus amphitrite]|uniref:isocitrate dehydrogenase [NADP], mitochondrial-like n=1 Tax=Amphibalanus amphitrite TaxID=1232801 RepID=UPI001C92A538